MSVPAPVAYVGRGALPPRGSDPPSARGAGAVDSGDQPGFGALLGGLMQAPENSPPPRPADTATPDGTEWTRDPAASAKEQDPAARAPSASTQPRSPSTGPEVPSHKTAATSTHPGKRSPAPTKGGGTATGAHESTPADSHPAAAMEVGPPPAAVTGRPRLEGRPIEARPLEASAAGTTAAGKTTTAGGTRKADATPAGWESLRRRHSSAGQTPGPVSEASAGAAASLAPGAAGMAKGGSPAPDAASGAAAKADVLTPDRDLSDLSPELRQKVERVVDRMARERGEKVVLTEGYRTPARQEYLYSQGRTRPGPVVTWTQHSLHSRGLAADLQVEGAKKDPGAYKALQRIAGEEGLTTLGMKDPGHVELEAGGDGAGRPSSAPPTAPGRRAVTTTGTASVARVATPAAVASTARVAAVARPGARIAQSPVAPTASAAKQAQSDRRATVDDRKSGSNGAQHAEPSAAATSKVSASAISTPSTPTILSRPTAATVPVGGAAGVERAMELKEALGSASPSRVSLRMDGAGGPVDRLQVSLVDSVLRGRVDVDDGTLATRLRADQGALLRSLSDKGFDPQALSVRLAAQSGVEAAHAARDSMVGALHLDATSGALRSMLSGEGTNSQGSSQQGSRGTGGWAGSRQRGAFEHRSQEEQRRERR